MELQVIWDGSHGNADRDLLCVAGIPQKRDAPKIEPDTGRVNRSQLRIATALEGGPLTCLELMQATGLSQWSVRQALDRLRGDDIVEVRARIPKAGSGSAVCVYALKPEDS